MAKIKANEIFKLKDLDKRWKWVARNKNGLTALFSIKPTKSKDYWTVHDECFCISDLFNDLELDFGTNDWTKCIAERPIDYSKYIGKLGIFADDEEKLNYKAETIYILSSINNKSESIYKFTDIDGACWKYFRPLTKEEIEKLTDYGE